jgi:hypothetical protein
MTIDTLHCLYLGIMLVWCRTVMWLVLPSGVYGSGGLAEESLATSLLVLRIELLNWYPEYERKHPGEVLTRVSDLTIKMFGKASEPKCKTKGAETWGFLLFLCDVLLRHADSFGGRGLRLLAAGRCLERIVRVWQRSPRIVPKDCQEECFAAYMEHVSLMKAEDTFAPKHHLFVHLLCKKEEMGSPKFFSTWEDEAWNKKLKASCRFVSQATFENTVLTRMSECLKDGLGENQRKRRAWRVGIANAEYNIHLAKLGFEQEGKARIHVLHIRRNLANTSKHKNKRIATTIQKRLQFFVVCAKHVYEVL